MIHLSLWADSEENATSGADSWETFLLFGETQWKSCPITFIEGFEFEQGYLFTLKVRIVHLANPPQDSYDVRYILVSLVSKTKVEL